VSGIVTRGDWQKIVVGVHNKGWQHLTPVRQTQNGQTVGGDHPELVSWEVQQQKFRQQSADQQQPLMDSYTGSGPAAASL
jgi:hypothetical protein